MKADHLSRTLINHRKTFNPIYYITHITHTTMKTPPDTCSEHDNGNAQPVESPVDRILPSENAGQEALTFPSHHCCCPRRQAFLDGNPEAIAWALDTVATSIIYVGSGAFLATALIKVNAPFSTISFCCNKDIFLILYRYLVLSTYATSLQKRKPVARLRDRTELPKYQIATSRFTA